MNKQIKDVTELKVGDRIKILNKPKSWSSMLHTECPLFKKEFPTEITIKGLLPIANTPITCGDYGWSLRRIIEAGCDLIKYSALPEKWFIIGGTIEFKEFMKTQSTFWTGNGNQNGYHIRKFNNKWTASRIDHLVADGYTEISVEEYIRLSNHNRHEETTKKSVTQKAQTAMQIVDNKIISAAGTIYAEIVKEVFVTRTIKVKSVRFDKKDKAQEKPFVSYVERDVSLSIIIDENGQLYAGYSIRNPKWDKENKPELAKTVARNRAVHSRTNLLKLEQLTYELRTKHVLKGIADQIFANIAKGITEIKGVK